MAQKTYRGTPLSAERICQLMRELYMPGLKARVQALAVAMRVQLIGKKKNEGHPLTTIWETLGEMEAYLAREKKGKAKKKVAKKKA